MSVTTHKIKFYATFNTTQRYVLAESLSASEPFQPFNENVWRTQTLKSPPSISFMVSKLNKYTLIFWEKAFLPLAEYQVINSHLFYSSHFLTALQSSKLLQSCVTVQPFTCRAYSCSKTFSCHKMTWKLDFVMSQRALICFARWNTKAHI